MIAEVCNQKNAIDLDLILARWPKWRAFPSGKLGGRLHSAESKKPRLRIPFRRNLLQLMIAGAYPPLPRCIGNVGRVEDCKIMNARQQDEAFRSRFKRCKRCGGSQRVRALR